MTPRKQKEKDALAEQRSRRVVPIQDALNDFLARRGLAERPLAGKVFSAWRSAAGKGLAGRAVPCRFRSGELTVEVSSSAHLQELTNFTGEELRRRANEILGCERIRSVVFKRKS